MPKIDESTASTDNVGTDTAADEATAHPYRDEALRLGKRWRHQALPLALIGATHGVGAVTASLAGPEAIAAAAGGIAGTAGAYGYAHTHASRWDRVYAGITAASSAAGQLAIAAGGADSAAAAMMWAAGCALAVPWWVRHTEPDPDVTAELAAAPAFGDNPVVTVAEPETLPPGVVDPRVELWNTYLAAPGKTLVGSALSDVTEFQYGWKAIVEVPVEGHWNQVFDARKKIMSVYDTPDASVFIESLVGQSVRRCRITVLTRDPLQEITRWTKPGLDPDEGSFPLMVTADADTLLYQLWNPGEGAAHGLVSGGTRSGKTKVLDVLLTECSMSDRIYPLVADGGGGASLPQWIDRVPMFAKTLADAKKLLKYALTLMEQRRPVLIDQGGGSIEPSPEHPLIPIIIDEAHKFLMSDLEFRRLCEIVAQEGAKFAIGLHLATQVASATQLGGSTVLRDQLKSGTVIGLRVTERTSENMISAGDPMPESLKALPAKFPNGQRTRGLGYSMTDRKIRSRALLLENAKDFPVTTTELEDALASIPAPRMGVEEEPSLHDQPSAPGSDEPGSAEDSVVHALADGCAKNPIAVMQATGLSMAAARAALKRIDA